MKAKKKNIITNNFLVNFFKESFQELKKVAWPKRKDVLKKTLIVVFSMVTIAIIIGALDYGFSHGTEFLLKLNK